MRIALGIEYDGSRFIGWQRQHEGRSVQQSVEDALTAVADHGVGVVCAGRTDTGVHATAQVVHFDTGAQRTPDNWLLGGNANLPDDVRLQWAMPVDDEFHARFSARQRSYRYVIHNTPVATALLRNQACHEHRPLDAERMQAAANRLIGRHDFSSFRASACQAKSPVREVTNLAVNRAGDFIYIDISANAFLHHMVRCVAGVLMTVGRGDQPAGWVAEVLAARDRAAGGVTAPAGGLYLTRVSYDSGYGLPVTARIPGFGSPT